MDTDFSDKSAFIPDSFRSVSICVHLWLQFCIFSSIFARLTLAMGPVSSQALNRGIAAEQELLFPETSGKSNLIMT